MPTQTFLNLPEEKRVSILEAAKSEFSRVDYTKSSINRIIQDAHIPRGSFYMYFEDKKDLLLYLLEEMISDVKKTVFQGLLESKGNLEQALLLVFDYFYSNFESKENHAFFRHVMPFLQSEAEDPSLPFGGKRPFKEDLFKIIPFLEPTQFGSTDPDFIQSTIEIVFSVLQNVLVSSFILNNDRETARKKLKEYLAIIRNGYMGKERTENA